MFTLIVPMTILVFSQALMEDHPDNQSQDPESSSMIQLYFYTQVCLALYCIILEFGVSYKHDPHLTMQTRQISVYGSVSALMYSLQYVPPNAATA